MKNFRLSWHDCIFQSFAKMSKNFPCFFHNEKTCTFCNRALQQTNLAYDVYTLMLNYNISMGQLKKLTKIADVILRLNGMSPEVALCPPTEWSRDEVAFLFSFD